ncbi:MAG: response regulator [Candidatus Binatia bacterium]|jgi:chemosensory pili system protein ChpA (sensor histidine kinase/response regulator)
MAGRFTLEGIEDLFRDDVLRFLRGMHACLTQLVSNPQDAAALDDLRALGHSLKGTASLVSLTSLSRAGAVIERIGEVAGTYRETDVGQALAMFREMQASLVFVERMLDDSLAGNNPETQENLYTELLMTFSPRVRSQLHDLNVPEVPSARQLSAETSPAAGDDGEWANELAEAFALELQEHLSQIPEFAKLLSSPDTQGVACAQLARIFHTINGSAVMPERDDVASLAKRLQEDFAAAAEQPVSEPLSARFIAAAQSALEALCAAAGRPAPQLAPVQPPPPSAPQVLDTELERELLDAFTIDATETIEAVERVLLDLERQPEEHSLLRELFRHFHTLKGAAAAVGLEQVAEQLHHAESLLEEVLDGGVAVDAVKLVDFLFQLTDSVTALINRARGVLDEQRRVLSDVAREIAALTQAPAPPVLPKAADTRAAAPQEVPPPAVARREHETIVRVQAARLDALMNQVGQLVVSRTRMERNLQAFAELRDKLYYCQSRLAQIIEGFQERYEFNTGERAASPVARPGVTPGDGERQHAPEDDFFTDLEFDKYDDLNILARSVIELATDTGEIAEQLGGFIDALGDETRQFSKITSGLQRQITRVRLVPLDTVFRRLLRPVRDAARQQGKLVDLQLVGGDVQLDKSIVEALYPPLLHMLRNAVSHGIEPPAARQGRGKPAVGVARVVAMQRHNSMLLSVQDDGAGLDFEAVLAKGRALGLVAPDAKPARDQLLPLIFRPGFTTGEAVNGFSGRGMGLDVVARDIAALNGSMVVDSTDGQGATIRIALPTTTSIDEVLLFQAGAQSFALPIDFIEQVMAIEMAELMQVDGQQMLKVRNELLPVLILAPLVGEPAPAENAVAVLLRAGDRAMALIVNRVHAQQEVVIRPLGPLLDTHPFLSGATISGAGAVIFVLHVGRLFDMLASVAAREAMFILGESSDVEPTEARAVLFVDDSISVRKLAARFLETSGLEVDTAVDGLDALEKLASGRFRVVITDLEMPRMHGYELIAEIRRHPQYRHLPVIVCTSRSSEKHRRRARELGAQGYITKPFTKEQLLADIQRLTQGGAAAAPQQATISAPE